MPGNIFALAFGVRPACRRFRFSTATRLQIQHLRPADHKGPLNPTTQSPEAALEPLLSARELHKTYVIGRRTLEVLRGVGLTVQRGELLALRGASGAGKSTLLHLLGGLDTPNKGEIWFAGENLAGLSRLKRARLRNRRVG